MINDFFATLDNHATAPVGFIWPTFTPRQIGTDEAAIRAALIGVGLAREQHATRCMQLINIVEESPLVSYLRQRDQRITYTKKSLRDRFALSGTISQYVGSNEEHGTANLVLKSTTPDVAAWDLQFDDDSILITDDLGQSVSSEFSYSDGVTSIMSDRNSTAQFLISGGEPVSGDSWTVSYQAAGASWIPFALTRLATVNPVPLMSAELASWFYHAPTSLDRLAAVVAMLGTRS